MRDVTCEMPELHVTRRRAGYYEWTFRGEKGEILYERTDYGDEGWFYYYDLGTFNGEMSRSDFPVYTLRVLKEMIVRTILHNQEQSCPT